MDYGECAQSICNALGGDENILNVSHCATRLRFITKSTEKCDIKALLKIDGVKGVFSALGQLQVVIGGNVSDVYDMIVNRGDAFHRINERAESAEKQTAEILSPVSGKIIQLEAVDDAVFSSGVLGMGAAVVPDGSSVRAPFNGSVMSISKSGHALGMVSDDGAELLIHIGINTSSLSENAFRVYVKDGEKVRSGQILIDFDAELIKRNGCDPATMIIVSNSDDYSEIVISGSDKIKAGERLIKLKK